jgi:hypothetical protein
MPSGSATDARHRVEREVERQDLDDAVALHDRCVEGVPGPKLAREHQIARPLDPASSTG